MGRSSPPPPKKEQTRQALGPRFDLKLMALLCQFYSLQRVHPALAVAETLLTEEHQKNSKSIHAENGSSSEIHPRGAANKASGAAAEAAREGIPQSRRWSEPE